MQVRSSAIGSGKVTSGLAGSCAAAVVPSLAPSPPTLPVSAPAPPSRISPDGCHVLPPPPPAAIALWGHMQPATVQQKVAPADEPAAALVSANGAGRIVEPTAKQQRSRTPSKAGRKLQPVDAARVEPVRIAAEPKLSATRSPGAYRGRCLYQSRKCENERAVKRNGKPHNLCEEHRSKQNQHQRKFDAKKFSRKRRRSSASEEEEGGAARAPSKRRHKQNPKSNKVAKQEPGAAYETTDAVPMTNYPYAGAPTHVVPMQPPPPTLFLPPAVVYAHASPTSTRQAYAVPYADYRAGAEQVVSTSQALPPTSHRPYVQERNLQPAQLPSGYSQSELVAASVLLQPSPAALSRPYFKAEMPPALQSRGPSVPTPRLLPSLRVPLVPTTGECHH